MAGFNLFSVGVSDTSSTDVNFNVPTNPRAFNTGTQLGSNLFLFSMVCEDNATSITWSNGLGSGALDQEHSNISTTKGFRIRCRDNASSTGIVFNPNDFATYDYFVLVHSDNANLHHFAKITEIKTEDVAGDAFEFTPSLGKEIPKDSKFKLFRGPLKTQTGVLAVSAGISSSLQNDLVIARPLYYFYNERLNKKNELDHNEHYHFSIVSNSFGTSSQLMPNPSSVHGTSFVTVPANGVKGFTATTSFTDIIDYSKFKLKVKMIDKLRDLDSVRTGTLTSNEGLTETYDDVLYNKSFINAKRDSDNDISMFKLYTGPKRYLHYDTSPVKVNVLTSVYSHNTQDSIEQGGFSETSLVDGARIMNKKIQENLDYNVKQLVHRGDLSEFLPLKAIYSTTSSTNTFTFNTEYDLTTMLNTGDEVKLGNKILIVDTIASFTNTSTPQQITFRAEIRGLSDLSFATGTHTPAIGEVLHRRAFNPTNMTLLTNMDLIDQRFTKLQVSFTSNNLTDLFADITACDLDKSLLTLSFNGDSYYGNSLNYVSGEYRIHVDRFEGEVEEISTKKENGQTILELKGRSKLNKLLSPIINNDSLFSEDIIYSSSSPYNRLKQMVNVNTALTKGISDEIITEFTAPQFSSATGMHPDDIIGKHAFTAHSYIGKIVSNSTTVAPNGTDLYRWQLEGVSLVNLKIGQPFYVEIEKNYIFSKALGSSHLTENKSTSLSGTAGKGVIFTSGKTLTGTHLPSTSGNTNVNALGYDINSPDSIAKDESFQCKIGDENVLDANGNPTANEYDTFDTVNTLMDFEVVNVSKSEFSTEIELAPYVPITLGRISSRYTDLTDITFTKVGEVVGLPFAFADFKRAGFISDMAATGNLKKNDPLYLGDNKVFLGLVLAVRYEYNHTNGEAIRIAVELDSANSNIVIGDDIYLGTKKSTEVAVINGAHLWGGKIVCMADTKFLFAGNGHHTASAGDLLNKYIPYFNSGLTSNSNTNGHISLVDMAHREGQPYFKVNGITLGNFGEIHKNVVSLGLNNLENNYIERKAKLEYLLNSYRFKPNIGSDNVVETNTTDTTYPFQVLLHRGFEGVYGSPISQLQNLHKEAQTLVYGTASFRDVVTPFDNSGTFPATVDMIGGGSAILHIFNGLLDIDNSAARTFIFITSDLVPYSSMRDDSLYGKDLTDYNLFLLENKKQVDKEQHGGNLLSIKDSNYQTVSITNNVDLSTLSRFGLMRLTECVFNFNMRPINPERKIINPRSPTTVDSVQDLTLHTNITLHAGVEYTNNINSARKITFSNTPSPAYDAGDKIYSRKGHYIATIDSGEIQDGNFVSYALTHDPYSTEGGAYATSVRIDRVPTGSISRSVGTFPRYNDSIFASGKGADKEGNKGDFFSTHLKSVVLPVKNNDNGNQHGYTDQDSGTGGLGGYGQNAGEAVFETGNTRIILPEDIEILTPFIFEKDDQNPSDIYQNLKTSFLTIGRYYPTRLMARIKTYDGSSNSFTYSPFKGAIGVVLDTWNVEDGQRFILEKGNNTPVLLDQEQVIITTPVPNSLLQTPALTNRTHYHLALKANSHFKERKTIHSTTADAIYDLDKPPHVAAGADIGLKFRLWTGNYTIVGNTITIPTQSGDNQWLEFIDLTGCYLVEETGTEMFTPSATQANTMQDKDVSLGNSFIAYVLSHEIKSSSSNTCLIKTDVGLNANTAYRIMQPNEVCMYNFMDTKIKPYVMSGRYTKMQGEDRVYDVNEAYHIADGANDFTREGVLSMFVFVDPDKQTNDPYLVIRDKVHSTALLPPEQTVVYFSDGDKGIKTTIEYTEDTQNPTFIIGEMETLKGIVSVSQPFTITTPNPIDIDPTRACIGTTVSIAEETEELVNDLLENEDLPINITPQNYPVYIAPNFVGNSLFQVINSVLGRKDLSLLYDNDEFKILNKQDNSFYINTIINDNSILEYEKLKSMFDFHNEVIVYGNTHKSTKKDLRSIKKIGRKTLEVEDKNLITLEEVDKKAQELLQIHSQLTNTIKVKINMTGFEQLRAGDIVQLESTQENLELRQYIVLEMIHTLDGFIELELGNYSKRLEDIFSDLLLESQKVKSSLRKKNHIEKSNNFSFLDGIKIKEISLLIRRRTTTGTTLGFSTPLNTSTNPLGFGGGSVTFTNVLEEDLL